MRYVTPLVYVIDIPPLNNLWKGSCPSSNAERSLLGCSGTHLCGKWTGGETVVVQVGDQLDRGSNEIAILLLLERLTVCYVEPVNTTALNTTRLI